MTESVNFSCDEVDCTFKKPHPITGEESDIPGSFCENLNQELLISLGANYQKIKDEIGSECPAEIDARLEIG